MSDFLSELDQGEPDYVITITKDGFYHWAVSHGGMKETAACFTLWGAKRQSRRAARRWMASAVKVHTERLVP